MWTGWIKKPRTEPGRQRTGGRPHRVSCEGGLACGGVSSQRPGSVLNLAGPQPSNSRIAVGEATVMGQILKVGSELAKFGVPPMSSLRPLPIIVPSNTCSRSIPITRSVVLECSSAKDWAARNWKLDCTALH